MLLQKLIFEAAPGLDLDTKVVRHRAWLLYGSAAAAAAGCLPCMLAQQTHVYSPSHVLS